jgi:hypothetical protein
MAMRYWETLFDPRFMWDREWKQRRDIEDNADQLEAIRDNETSANAALHQQIHDLSLTVMALVEMLVDAKQLDPQELRARVQAAVIGERNEARKTADPAQDAWDTAKPR